MPPPTPSNTNEVTFAHISDLHFSSGMNKNGDHSHSIEHLVQIQDSLRRLSPRFLIVSGDITNHGDSESLLRAYGWLFNKEPIGGGEFTGLSFPIERTFIVPGNHDAWNSTTGTNAHRLQRSLDNYRSIFPPEFHLQGGVTYRWIDLPDSGLYIVSVDSSFLGDSGQPGSGEAIGNIIDRVACGKVSLRQSRQLLDWFNSGMSGTLAVDPIREDAGTIPRDSFARSVKMLVMHHYIFEPPGVRQERFMKVHHAADVLRNLLMADFDLVVCGHKHVPAVQSKVYARCFGTRGRRRHLTNCFRQLLGLHSRPLIFSDARGKMLSRALSWLTSVFAGKTPRASFDANKCIDALVSIIDDPVAGEGILRDAFSVGDLGRTRELDDEEIRDLRSVIAMRLDKAQRRALATAAKAALESAVARLADRSFIQLMSGSSSKRGERQRTFNFYSFKRERDGIRLLVHRNDWIDGRFDETKPPLSIFFSDDRRGWKPS